MIEHEQAKSKLGATIMESKVQQHSKQNLDIITMLLCQKWKCVTSPAIYICGIYSGVRAV